MGADINSKSYDHTTPLHIAVKNGKYNIVSLLIDAGAKLSLKDNLSHSPLFYSIQNGYDDISRYLIERGAEITSYLSEMIPKASSLYTLIQEA